MNIILNGKPILTEQTTLEALLSEQGYDDCVVATAVNQEFVAALDRATTQLIDGAQIDVVAPMQGG